MPSTMSLIEGAVFIQAIMCQTHRLGCACGGYHKGHSRCSLRRPGHCHDRRVRRHRAHHQSSPPSRAVPLLRFFASSRGQYIRGLPVPGLRRVRLRPYMSTTADAVPTGRRTCRWPARDGGCDGSNWNQLGDRRGFRWLKMLTAAVELVLSHGFQTRQQPQGFLSEVDVRPSLTGLFWQPAS